MGSDYRGNRVYACSGRKVEIFKHNYDTLEAELKYMPVEAKKKKNSINSDVVWQAHRFGRQQYRLQGKDLEKEKKYVKEKELRL